VKIAISGATGFIGRHVVAEMKKRSLQPTLLVRPGRSVAEPNQTVIECDLKNPPEDLYQQLGRPDVLIHLAWGGLPQYASLHHFEEELPAHYQFLKQLIRGGLKRCLITGTCLEYGKQEGELVEERPACPIVPYAFAKDSLRRQLEFLRMTQEFHLTWARLFYTYGEGQAAASLYSQLRAAVARGDKVFDMSGGEQVRDYLPVDAVARALTELASIQTEVGIVNVCAGHGVTVRRLVEEWVQQNQWQITLNFGRLPYLDYEAMNFWGSDRKLKTVLNGRSLCEISASNDKLQQGN
jgi:Nucleoside-diphosphate-sugar epimerases